MRRVLGIAKLTFLEGIRMKIVLVLVVIMFFVVFRLPARVEGDDTVAGRLQTFLKWSLDAVSALLALATVFLACFTLSNELKTRSLQMVVSKPVSRFEILLGKWLGINVLNVLLLGTAGAIIFFFANSIRQQPVKFERDAYKVRDTIWTARVAAEPAMDELYKNWAEQAKNEAEQAQKEGLSQRSVEELAAEKFAQIRNEWRVLRPREARLFLFKDLPPTSDPDVALQVQFRVRTVPVPMDEAAHVIWTLVDPDSGRPISETTTQERSGDTHQFLFKSAVVKNGRVLLMAESPYEPPEETRIMFDGDKPLAIYYRMGSFEVNYLKALLIIWFQLAFLSAFGLFFSVFVSFPIAAMCTFSVYLIGLAWNWWYDAIGGNITVPGIEYDPYGKLGKFIRPVIVAFMNWFVPNLNRYDGVSLLIWGEYISVGLVLETLMRMFVFGATVLLLPGWLVFRRREVAQVTI